MLGSLAAFPCYEFLVSFKNWVKSELLRLESAGILRPSRPGAPASEQIDAYSNDYFGLAQSVVSRATLLNRSPGAGASRLIYGNRDVHEELESTLAHWVHQPASLLFSSGYAANVGTLTALCNRDSVIVSDALNHASIIDGARLARAEVQVVPHLDLEAIERALTGVPDGKQALVVTESYFSMNGDQPDIGVLASICARHQAALMIDEAHALGVYGHAGSGLCTQAQVKPDILVGTLGKAVGVQGAFVACEEPTRALLWNRARSFVFSTATSPLLADLTLQHVRQLQAAEADRARLRNLAAELRTLLQQADFQVMPSDGPIVPIRMPDFETAKHSEDALREAGILTRAIRPPTVPAGTERLRLTVHADWPDDLPTRIVNTLVTARR